VRTGAGWALRGCDALAARAVNPPESAAQAASAPPVSLQTREVPRSRSRIARPPACETACLRRIHSTRADVDEISLRALLLGGRPAGRAA
jgi:hypothetical protein